MEMIERHVTISNEALAVFVRFWLTEHARACRTPRLRPPRPKGASATTDSLRPSVGGWRAAVNFADKVARDVVGSEPKPSADYDKPL